MFSWAIVLSCAKIPQSEPSMKVGSCFTYAVDLYSSGWMAMESSPRIRAQAEPPTPEFAYEIEACVAAADTVSGIPSWKVEFTPSPKAPKGVRDRVCTVWISREDSSIVKFAQRGGLELGAPKIRNLGNVSFLTGAPFGFPLDGFFFNVPGNAGEKERHGVTLETKHFKAHEETKGGETERTLDIIQGGGIVQETIKQRWKSGWLRWTSYEKTVAGHRSLIARLTRAR